MTYLIDKDAIVARIKKLKMDIGNIFNEYDDGFWEGRTTAFDDVICALDTLEVKEVDLEHEIEKIKKMQRNFEIKNGTIIEFCAKHFFELGLKAKDK